MDSNIILSTCKEENVFEFYKRMVNMDRPKKRVVFVLIAGMADLSLPRFGYKPPLQVAKTPHLDAVASAGFSGLLDPVEVGLTCGSDTVHLSLMGYDPRDTAFKVWNRA